MLRWLPTVIWGQQPHFTLEQADSLRATKHYKALVFLRVTINYMFNSMEEHACPSLAEISETY